MKLCECGCGGEVKNKARFVSGHNSRIDKRSIDKKLWKESMQGKLFCSCGCGKELEANEWAYQNRHKKHWAIGHNFGERSTIEKCKECKKDFSCTPYQRKKSQHGVFCSKKCWYSWWPKNLIGDKSKHSKKISFICGSCGVSYLRSPSNIKKGDKHFCSRKCKYVGDTKRCGENGNRWEGMSCSIEGCTSPRHMEKNYHFGVYCKDHGRAVRNMGNYIKSLGGSLGKVRKIDNEFFLKGLNFYANYYKQKEEVDGERNRNIK